MQKQSFIERISHSLIFLPMVASLTQALFVSLYLPIPFYKTLIIVLFSYLILSILFLSLRVTLPTSALVFGVIWLFNRPIPLEWGVKFMEFFQWTLFYPLGSVPLEEPFVMPFAFLAIGIVSTIFYLITHKINSVILPLFLGSSLLGLLWFLGHTHITPYIWGFAFSLVLIMAKRRYRKLQGSSYLPNPAMWLVWTIPFALIAVVTPMVLIPGDTTSLKWEALEDMTEDIREKRFNRSEFTQSRQPFRLSSTGFTESDNHLGGPVELNRDIVLKVKSPFPAYLRGSILNNYTGRSWQDTIEDQRYSFADKQWNKVRDRSFNMDEAIWDALNDADSSISNNPFLPYSMTIEHVGIKTSVLFNSHFIKDIEPNIKNSFTPYFNTKSETFTSRELKESESYTIEGMTSNMNDPQFIKFIDQYVNQLDNGPKKNNDEINQQYIMENYTQIPDSLPSRVHELTISIVNEIDSDYEKAMIIRDYLKDNYSYTLNTPYTPLGEDFVDFFLFELEEGYCTYFATAMAVMGRSIGLPTRYIEGFSMSSASYENHIYNVRNSHAHAWVEVYFPNIGWLPFDPTPISPEASQNNLPNSGSSSVDYLGEYLRNNEEIYDQPPSLPREETPESNSIKGASWFIYLFFLLLALMALTAILIISFWYVTARLKPKRYSHTQKVSYYYNEILWLMELYSFPKLPGETPYAYGKRVDAWLINKNISMNEVTRILIESRFASCPPTKEEAESVEGLYRDVERDTIKILGIHIFILLWIKKALSHY
ncbi:MAG TPA: transglutaminase domain-containing protein [Clostridia bacterium]|nr:transglutaminase domain-containing protein [Clostridia bacterium]